MAKEEYPKDFYFIESVLYELACKGELQVSQEAQVAVEAVLTKDLDNPVVQQLRGEALVIDATDDLPEDLTWIWNQVVEPRK